MFMMLIEWSLWFSSYIIYKIKDFTKVSRWFNSYSNNLVDVNMIISFNWMLKWKKKFESVDCLYLWLFIETAYKFQLFMTDKILELLNWIMKKKNKKDREYEKRMKII